MNCNKFSKIFHLLKHVINSGIVTPDFDFGMTINSQTAQLGDVADEYARQLALLGQTVDQLVKFLAEAHPNQLENALGNGVVFRHWPNREYQLFRKDSSSDIKPFALTSVEKSECDLLTLCDLIKAGWLAEVIKNIEAKSARVSSGAAQISLILTTANRGMVAVPSSKGETHHSPTTLRPGTGWKS